MEKKKELPTIDIKGKEYVMVKDRLIHFNEVYPKGSIQTEILSNDSKSVVAKATVRPDDIRAFTGHSEAYRQGNMGNVPVEVAETSAVGRALAFMGIGIIESVASGDEIVKASYSQQNAPESTNQVKFGGKPAPTLKPATEKQKAFIAKLHKERGLAVPSAQWFKELEITTAKHTIDALLKEPVNYGGEEAAQDRREQEANQAFQAESRTEDAFDF